MADLSVADALDRAADLIEPEGSWTQGFRARSSCKPHCMGYAIERVGGVASDCLPTLSEVCAFDPLIGLSGLTGWNDAPERTQAEVVSKLREAAALARKEAR